MKSTTGIKACVALFVAAAVLISIGSVQAQDYPTRPIQLVIPYGPGGTTDLFFRAINESLEYASAHPAEARAIVTTYTKITPDVVGRLVLPAWPTTLDPLSAAAVGKAAEKFGALKNAPDPHPALNQP